MTDDLVKWLRDEDSYYRWQEKHWCIDFDLLERLHLEAADRIEALTAENERLAEAGAKQAFEVGVLREALDWMSNSEPLVVEAILSRVSAALGDTQ
jgi:hypothetical protein